MLKVKGVLVKSLNRMVMEEYGKEGYYKVLKIIKRSMRDMFENPVPTKLYLAEFYEEFLKATSLGTGLTLKEVGAHKFHYLYDMLRIVFEKFFTSYEDAILNATKISNHILEGLEWKAETLEKNKKYKLIVQSPYRLDIYPAFWEAAVGFIESLLSYLGARNPKVDITRIGFNDVEMLVSID